MAEIRLAEDFYGTKVPKSSTDNLYINVDFTYDGPAQTLSVETSSGKKGVWGDYDQESPLYQNPCLVDSLRNYYTFSVYIPLAFWGDRKIDDCAVEIKISGEGVSAHAVLWDAYTVGYVAPPVEELVIDLDSILILKAGGRSFSEVGADYGVLESPLVQASLSGVTINWQNIDLAPAYYWHDEWEQWTWWVSFDPQFPWDIWRWDEEEEEEEEGAWWSPPLPAYKTVINYYRTNYPPIGGPYLVDIRGLHSGGWSSVPGIYDGIFFLRRFFMGHQAVEGFEWRVKNMMRVTG